MRESTKATQLQIRVSATEKRAIARAARRAGMDMSSFVRERVLGAQERRTSELMRQLANEPSRRFALAELHDILSSASAQELRRATALAPPLALEAQTANYVAAMVECACARGGIEMPAWTRAIPPLATPLFGSQLMSLRLHLLAHSPAPFRRRNIYIDTSIGGRV